MGELIGFDGIIDEGQASGMWHRVRTEIQGDINNELNGTFPPHNLVGYWKSNNEGPTGNYTAFDSSGSHDGLLGSASGDYINGTEC